MRTTLTLLGLILAVSLLGVQLSPHDYAAVEIGNPFAAPSAEHPFGTDEVGRDVFVRAMAGTQVTLLVAVVSSLVSLVIGVLYGAVAGYAGGRVDAAMMRLVDALFAIPFIFLVILLMATFGRSFLLVFVAIGAINWLDMARIVRGQTLSLREREFVQAARLTGVPPWRILLRHIVPNLFGVVAVYLTLTIPQAMLVESFLSFLGLGIQEPRASLGALVRSGSTYYTSAWHLLLFPAALLAIVLLCFNFLGDALRDATDARSSR